MKMLRPVRWKEGMFLRPHHFQQFDLYLESRETARLRALDAHSWGVSHLEIHPEALGNFAFHVAQLRVILPDGTYLDVPENAQLPVRSFERLLTEPGKPLTVYLGVRAREERRAQVRKDSTGQAITRFQSVERDVYDLDAGESAATLELLDYDLRLFFGDESQQGFDVIPLSQVVGRGDPARPVSVVETFAPPSLSLRASPALRESASAVLQFISQVLRDLSGRRDADVDSAVLYQTVSGAKAVLRDMVHDGRVHPQAVYHELVRLAGALYYRDPDRGSSDDLPTYDHRHPGPVFEKLREVIQRLAHKIVTRRFERFEMPRAETDNFALRPLPESARQAGARCYLEIEAGPSQPMLRELLRAKTKISCASNIETLRKYQLPGVPTEALPGPPPEIHDKPAATYFRLKQEHDDWNRLVLAAGDLTVHIIGAPADVKMFLVTIPPGA